MVARILVAYSRVPSAQLEEAARNIADVFARTGVEVVLRPVGEVESLGAYDSLVLCAPVGADHLWAEDASLFVARFRRDLAHMSVAYFVATGPGQDEHDPNLVKRGLAFVLNRINEVRPLSVGVFRLGRKANDWGDVRAFADRLKSNFISPTLGPQGGLREFLRPEEAFDHSENSGYGTVPGFARGTTATHHQIVEKVPVPDAGIPARDGHRH